MRLDGDIAAQRRAPFGFGDATACATMLYVADDAEELLEPVRVLLENTDDSAGVTLLEGLLIIRLLDADAPRLRSRVIKVAGLIRHQAGGFSATLAPGMALLTRIEVPR